MLSSDQSNKIAITKATESYNYKHNKKEKETKTPSRYVRFYENVKYFGTIKSKVRQNLLSSQPDAEFVFVWTDKLRKLFILQLFTRLLIELTFLFFYYLIQAEQHNHRIEVNWLKVLQLTPVIGLGDW